MSLSNDDYRDIVSQAKVKKFIDGSFPDNIQKSQRAVIEECFINFLIRSFMIEEWSEQEYNNADDIYDSKSICLEDIRNQVYETIIDYVDSKLPRCSDNIARLEKHMPRELEVV